MLFVDSFQERIEEGLYNWYDKHHIDRVKSLVDMEECASKVERQLLAMKLENEAKDAGNLIKVKVR
jgi:hypothetical protein